MTFNAQLYKPNSEFAISFQLRANMDINEIKGINISAYLVDSLGAIVYHLSTTFDENRVVPFSDKAHYTFTIPKLRLKPGSYNVWIWLQANGIEQDYIDQRIQFDVEDGNIYDHPRSDISIGLVQLDNNFSIEHL